MRLTEHFTLAELVSSDYAIRQGIDNLPTDPHTLENIHTLADGLERVRAVLGRPIVVTSGYRSPAVNTAVGGAKDSAHLRGLAADIIVPGMSPVEVARVIMAHPQVGWSKLIHEGTWTHIAFPEAGHEAEHMVLTAIFKKGQPTNYVKGIV